MIWTSASWCERKDRCKRGSYFTKAAFECKEASAESAAEMRASDSDSESQNGEVEEGRKEGRNERRVAAERTAVYDEAPS